VLDNARVTPVAPLVPLQTLAFFLLRFDRFSIGLLSGCFRLSNKEISFSGTLEGCFPPLSQSFLLFFGGSDLPSLSFASDAVNEHLFLDGLEIFPNERLVLHLPLLLYGLRLSFRLGFLFERGSSL